MTFSVCDSSMPLNLSWWLILGILVHISEGQADWLYNLSKITIFRRLNVVLPVVKNTCYGKTRKSLHFFVPLQITCDISDYASFSMDINKNYSYLHRLS